MKNNRKVKLLILILFLTEIISLFLTYKSFSNKEINEIKETYEVKNKTFSMFVENEEGDYSEYIESNLFPEGYEINVEKSKCVDTKGNVIEGILSGSGTNITVKSTTTSYCYLYFDINSLNKILQSEDIWKSTLEDDGIRFVGTNPSNYICFGTTDKNTCTSDTDKYMYRIIGVFEDSEGTQYLKLIKKEALNTSYAWHGDPATDTDWDESDLYNGINGNYFLTNTAYSYMQDSIWTNKIATWDYTATNTLGYDNYSVNSVYGPSYYYNTVKTIYLHEMNRSSKANCYYNTSTTADCSTGEWKIISAKIGLMYVSDYLLSLGESALDYTSSNSTHRASMKTGWMYISNNDSESLSTTASSPPAQAEWTMSRFGANSAGWYYALFVGSDGGVNDRGVYLTNSVRPVFYLTSDVSITGDGTIESPYIISQ